MFPWGKAGAPDIGPAKAGSKLGVRGGTAACLARILVLGQDQGRARELAKLLRGEGYAAFAGDFSVRVGRLSPDEHPDLALIDADDAGEKGLKLAASFKNGNGVRIPVMMLAESAAPETRRRCLEAGIDDLITPPYSDSVVLARLKPLIRLAIMEAELERRLATARGLGLDPGDVQDARRDTAFHRVLVVGDGTDDLSEVEKALCTGVQLIPAGDVFAAASMLHQEIFDALVAVIKGAGEDSLYFCSQLRNNTKLFDLPVLLVADGGAFESVDDPYRSGASAVVLRPVDEAELQTTIESLVRRQKRRHAIRDRLAAIKAKAGHAELGGVFGHDFLLAHLERLTGTARAWHKHLSLVSFQIQNLAWVVRDFGPGAGTDLMRQVAEWIGVLVRAEDLVARHSDKEFCVALPDTAIEEAEVVAQRITGVVLNTQFAVKGVDLPLGVWLQTGAAEYAPGDSPSTLIERAHRDLR